MKDDLIYGIHPVSEALQAGKDIDKVFVLGGHSSQNLKQLIQDLKSAKVPVKVVPQEKLNRLTRKNHQGVVAFLSSVEFDRLENVIPFLFENAQVPLVVLLDQISDVRNTGAIARTAYGCGAQAIVVPSRGGAALGSDAQKTSAGALSYISVCRVEHMIQAVRYLKESGLQIVACSEKSDRWIKKVDFTLPTAILMGSEDEGISKELLAEADHVVSIPIEGKVGSFNVSVASGMILYEASMQRLK
ncbi:MAG TPA: 23S rRNA (guanosine(2251)-2'-O)-methyltransferase RlmB [Bacteroidia bacterium]|nr:23S rRNA (guanosine(2251)-2'-O)-methyltransferase RlmB [Bacteroidia bacterium]HNT79959.1 23S rRNA (guanosine(2251)-2'-O)-methyltransferase RlmB [Bacteroidia bacterium]